MTVTTEQLNPFYNPDLANNGGGYDQPLIICTEGDDTLAIQDLSCGDFGTDITVWLYISGKLTAIAEYGSRAPKEFSSFNYSDPYQAFWLDFAEDTLHYHIPTRESIEY